MNKQSEGQLNCARKFYKNNKQEILKKQKTYRVKNLDKFRQYQREYHRKNKDKLNVYYLKKRFEQRMELLDLVGGRKCKNCGFADWRALQLDHKKSGGSKDIISGRNLKTQKEDAIKNPDKYQILCANCNWIKRHTHKEWGKEKLVINI